MGISESTPRFSFGRNWEKFVEDHLSEERIETAKESLTDFFARDDFSGLRFLDVGCGSGIFSLAAVELGAEVHSFDYDEESVETTRRVREKYAPEIDWTIERGDVLDTEFVERLGQFDLVYAWGVLHHTGSMYDAIDNTARLLNDDGELYLAIYRDDTENFITSTRWKRIKRLYVTSGPMTKNLLFGLYLTYWTVLRLWCRENPVTKARQSDGRDRGMTFFTDMRDWLGGYPYEYATADEIRDHVESTTDLELTRVELSENNGCSEYLFR